MSAVNFIPLFIFIFTTFTMMHSTVSYFYALLYASFIVIVTSNNALAEAISKFGVCISSTAIYAF